RAAARPTVDFELAISRATNRHAGSQGSRFAGQNLRRMASWHVQSGPVNRTLRSNLSIRYYTCGRPCGGGGTWPPTERTSTFRRPIHTGERGMFERIKTGWALAKQSFGVLRHDKELVVFPLLSGIACVLVLISFAVPLMSTPWFEELVDD